MSESPQTGIVPEWTIGDRMNKALSSADMSVAAMSEYLGLSRNSVSAYINDRQAPKRQTLMLWAMRTGVPIGWLETGEISTTPPDRPRGNADPDALAALTASKSRRGHARGGSRLTEEYGDAA